MYGEKQSASRTPEKELFDLAWDVQELERVNESGRQLLIEIAVLADKLKDPTYNKSADNFPMKVRLFKENCCKFLDSVVKYRRTPATHCLVFMISPEGRLKKPYALPIQCLAYHSLSDEKVRQLSQSVVKEMSKRGMKVAGKLFSFLVGT